MDAQTGAAIGNTLAASVTNTAFVTSDSEAALRGLTFNVDATKSTFKTTSTYANAYEVWFREMEDVDSKIVEDATKGLVSHNVFALCFAC